jgi:hypothetical protein
MVRDVNDQTDVNDQGASFLLYFPNTIYFLQFWHKTNHYFFAEYFLFTSATYAPGPGAVAMILSPIIENVPEQCFTFVFQMKVCQS